MCLPSAAGGDLSLDTIIAGLLPELAAKARTHLSRCEAEGLAIALTAGWRSPEEQMVLFTKGRICEDGAWSVVDPKRVVTNATPEHAPHCRGAAYDLVPIVAEKPAWDRLDLFAEVGRIGKALGLVWGGDWPKLKDMPHFELPNWRGLPLKDNA
jgi:peptidoglycan L-alanyl-D-glutamate endopeptidase CwlK